MDAFIAALYGNPIYYLGVILAVYAAFGFVYFMAGALSGLHHAILMDGNKEHMDHKRQRVGTGLGIMVEAFFAWEVIRLVGDWLAGNPIQNSGVVSFLIVAYLIILVGSFITGTKPAVGH